MAFFQREWALIAGFRHIWSLTLLSVATTTFLAMRLSDHAIAASNELGFLPVPNDIALGIEAAVAGLALLYVMMAAFGK